jgi:hypothetical protein
VGVEERATKKMKNNNKTVLILALLVTAGLFSIGAGLIWLGYVLTKANSGTATPTAGVKAGTQAISGTASQVNYTKLREYLQQKDWRAADRETYERLLEAAGPKAQAKGMTPKDEMEALSCTDIKTIDKLWSDATNGLQGFSAQQDILRAYGDYHKMYDRVGWQKLSGEWLIEWDYNPQTKRMDYKPEKEPNFKNPPPGHLPTVERGYNFGTSLDAALIRCSL